MESYRISGDAMGMSEWAVKGAAHRLRSRYPHLVREEVGRTVAEADETVIVTARAASDAELSHVGSVLGTPSYIAPEQARAKIDKPAIQSSKCSKGRAPQKTPLASLCLSRPTKGRCYMALRDCGTVRLEH
jgi:hypothetical protein